MFLLKMSSEHLIPGVFENNVNCRIYYLHISAAIVTVCLVLIVTTITMVTIQDVQQTMDSMNEVISDFNELMPDARFGIDMLHALCTEKNFTKAYPSIRDLCTK